MDKITKAMIAVLATLGFIYLMELKDTNPSVGIPMILVMGVMYLIAAFSGFQSRK